MKISGPGSMSVSVDIDISKFQTALALVDHPVSSAPEWQGKEQFAVIAKGENMIRMMVISADNEERARSICIANLKRGDYHLETYPINRVDNHKLVKLDVLIDD